MNQRIIIRAKDKMVLTNGVSYGRVVYLGCNDSVENWREITEEEYNAAMAAQEALLLEGVG